MKAHASPISLISESFSAMGEPTMARKNRGNKYLRYSVRGGFGLLCFCAVWTLVHRAACPRRAVLRSREAGPQTATLPGRLLRIGTFNIAHGRGTVGTTLRMGGRDALSSRLSAIAGLLNNQRLDLAVLNEVDFEAVWSYRVNEAETIAETAGFPFWVEQTNFDAAVPFARLRFGNAVLSRYPIEEASVVEFPGHVWAETVLAGKKEGLLCTVRLAPGLKVRVLAVHLEHRSEASRIEAAEIVEELVDSSALPMVVAGDFNSTLPGYPGAATDDRGRTAVSILLDGGRVHTSPVASPRIEDFTFRSTHPRSLDDWILVPRDWRIVSRTVVDCRLSDHLPVVMEAEVPSRAAEAPPRDIPNLRDFSTGIP